jgi:hypothetical protein
MKLSFLLVTVFLLPSSLVLAQGTSKPDEHNDLEHKRMAITGCLTRNSHQEFEIVDEKGVGYRPYSATVNLNQYVGQTVTLTGKPGSTHSVDAGAPAEPHFQVSKVQAASGPCKK